MERRLLKQVRKLVEARRRLVEPRLRLRSPIFVFGALVVLGGITLWLIGDGRWPIGETLYVALISITTVGSHELEGMHQINAARIATAAIIVAGIGVVTYFQSSLTAVFVQGLLGERFRAKRMQNQIDAMTGHVIVTGVGSTGRHVLEELVAHRTPIVAIDRDKETLERVSRELAGGKLLYVVGDATDDDVLLEAGILRAMGVVAALTEDKDNLFVTLSARSLNARARIATKVTSHDAVPKMIRAGASATVSPNMIGGRRLASEIVRPSVVQFIDHMLRNKDEVLRLEEVTVPDGSWFVGRRLRDVPIRAQTDVLVVALRVDQQFVYNPEPSTELEVGSVLVVLGTRKNVDRLRSMMKQRPTAQRLGAGQPAP
jgi:voltage-gated potassium channel